MRKSCATLAALVGAPVLLVGSSALALDVTFEQASGLAGGVALGAVGGPAGGFIGGMLGRAIGRTLHHPARQIDVPDRAARQHVTPIGQGHIVYQTTEDRVVDSTPIRMIEPAPTEADARTYLAAAPARKPERPRTYLASAPREETQARVIPIVAAASENPAAHPGTLDYQLDQLNARRAAEGEPQIQKIADIR